MTRSVRLWALMASLCLLAACGGGGGGGGGDKTVDRAPVAHALASGDVRMDGGVVHASVGGSVLFDASGSTDADGDALTFAWTLVSAPTGSAVPTSGTGSTLRWTPDKLGDYTFSVTASDPKGSTSTQQATVTVDNTAPAASVAVSATFTATPSQKPAQTVVVGGNVVLDATATTDPDGDAVNVTFELLAPDASAATLSVDGRVARFSPDMLGAFQVRVRGSDGKGATFETLYTFQANNRAPAGTVAVSAAFTAVPATMAQQSVTVGDFVTLDATATTDPDGDSVAVTFELAGPAGSAAELFVNGRVAHFTPDMLGGYQVKVKGIDAHGASFETRYPFQANNFAPTPITFANVTPVVGDGGSSVVTTSVGYDVVVDGSTSIDQDGDAVTYAWVLASKPAGSVATMQGAASGGSVGLSPDMLGDYVLQLTVSDSAGAQTLRTVTVRADNRRPIAVVGTNSTPQSLPSAPSLTVPLGTLVTLRADASTDADGDTLTDAWSIDSAPAGSHAALSSTSAAAPTFTADVEGSYVFRLRVTDSHGAFSERTVVLDVGSHAPVAVVDRGMITVLAGDPAQATAALSFDEDGDTLTYQWTVDARPVSSQAALSAANTAAVSFTPDMAGLYVLAVRVSDGHSTSIAYVNVRALGAFQSSVALDYVPGAAHYSLGLDKVVIASSSPNALHLVDPFTGARSAIVVPAPIKNFSLSPDGRLAAVLHEGAVSLVDLTAGTVLRSTSTGGAQTDAFVTNAGIIYAIGQTGGQWVAEPVVVIDGRTGIKITQNGSSSSGFAYFYGTQYGVLAGSLDKVFFLAQGLSPADISWFRFDESNSQVTVSGDSPYHGDFPMYTPLWMAGDDSLVFTADGNFFQSDTLHYAGQLAGIQFMFGFSHSAQSQEALVLTATNTGAYPTSYQRFTGSLLFPDTAMPLPLVSGQQSYALQIFHSSGGSHVVLVQTGSDGTDGHTPTGFAILAH